jgi:GTP-binding protein EngB required for normal cell division
MNMNGVLFELLDKVRELWEGEQKKPLKVSVMGQTGVGKSSLINALFNTNVPTDDIRPGTKKSREYLIKDAFGHELLFCDLPGIGESEQADEEYFPQYRQKLAESDIVIWAIHADSRSLTFDNQALRKTFETIEPTRQAELMRTMLFVLTKADLITPAPWVLSKVGIEGMFAPQGPTKKLLEQKALYFQNAFLLPYKDVTTSSTYHNGNFHVAHPRLLVEKHLVHYKGLLNKDDLATLKGLFPKHSDVFERLYESSQIIPCSSRFRYNLDLLMRVIIDKLATSSIGRFRNFHSGGTMGQMPFSEAREYQNIIVLDEARNRVFDLRAFEL